MSLNFQGLQGDEKRLMEHLEENVKLLASGWRERVEFTTQVKYHAPGCPKVDCLYTCEFRMLDEKRVRYIHNKGLLEQLQTYTKSKDTDRNPKAARQAPRVKKVKYMPELNGFFTLDEITCDVYKVAEEAYINGGRDRSLALGSAQAVIGGLTYQMGQIVATHPDIVNDVVKATSKWVAMARRTLNMTVAEAQFAGVVCENCNGALAIAWDNDSDVRCVGTPTTPPCGHTYPRSEWMALYAKGQQRNDHP